MIFWGSIPHPFSPKHTGMGKVYSGISVITYIKKGAHNSEVYPLSRGIIRKKLKSGNMFKHQRIFVVSKTTSNITRHF